MRRTTTALTAAALLLAGGISAAEAAKVCKPLYTSAEMKDPIEAVATAAASARWTAQVALKHTPKFANWSNAASRKVTCRWITSNIG